MVFQDGSHYAGKSAAFNSSVVLDNLIHEGAMPPTIGLFLNPGSMSPSGVFVYEDEKAVRSEQYDTPSATYSQFLLQEAIVDLVQSAYDIVEDPDGWAIGGHSGGGICALIAAWYQPNAFHKVLTHNAAFPNTGGAFPQLIAETDPILPLRVSLLGSSNDIGGNAPGQWFDTNNQAAAIFEEKGYHYRYLSGTGGHFPPTQAESDYPDALRWLWRGYSLPWYPNPQ
jgi:enterochelin esterase family protein